MDQRIKDLVDFKLIDKGESNLEATLVVHESLPSFKGHFPDNPILPAVSIIDITLCLLNEFAPNVSHSHIEVAKSKFTDIIRPKQEVKISATLDQGQMWKVQWRDLHKENKLAQLQLRLHSE